MPDLLQINGPHGPLASCGPACYDASFYDCHCICKSLNHSQGYKKALSNSLKYIKHLQLVEPNLILSLHSQKKLSKLVQLKILPADD